MMLGFGMALAPHTRNLSRAAHSHDELHSAWATLVAARDYLWITHVDCARDRNNKVRACAKSDLEAYSILHLLAIDLSAELEGRYD